MPLVTLKKQTPTETDALPKRFHWLEVADVHRETDQACSVSFALPAEKQDNFKFKQGQYLTLMKEFDGEKLRRPYSLCVSPAQGELRICAKRIPDGRMSGFINTELSVGDKLAVMEPNGRFYNEIDPAAKNHYVGIAGGSGITPVMSLLSSVLTQESQSRFTLLYGNRTSSDIIFREKLNDLKNTFLGRLQIVHVLSEEQTEVDVFHGLLDSERVELLITRLTQPATIDTFFICGPGPMMDGAERALLRIGVDADQIKIESFGSGSSVHAGTLSSVADDDNSKPIALATIKIGGKSKVVKIPINKSVLDAALSAKLDLPYACKGGVCCTCKARLLEGSVEMAVNYGLEADEIKAGYILTCQAVPTSDRLVVDYDV